MSKPSLLSIFHQYTVDEFIEFLKNNNLSEFETLAKRKNIDGNTFLQLAEFEINNWKPLINQYQAQKFWSFLNQLTQAPENFVFVASPRPVVPAKPPLDRRNLQKLTQNPSFINSLRAAVQGHVSSKKIEPEPPQSWSRSENTLEQNSAPLPPRPFNKKPLLPPQKFLDSESEDENEKIYESPDSEGESSLRNKAYNQKPLPELPVPAPPAAVSFPKQPAPPAIQKQVEQPPKESKPTQRQPFRLGAHYSRQREKERELRKLEDQKQNEALPVFRPSPVQDVSSKRNVSIPRPPRSLPQVDVPDVPNIPLLSKPPTIQQATYYRYTDRKGAEELLSEEFSDGTYLIRPSRSYYVTLSVRQGDKVYHIGVKKLENGSLEMHSAGLNLKFDTLDKIIEHFKKNPITVRNKYNAIIDIYLNKTLPDDRT